MKLNFKFIALLLAVFASSTQLNGDNDIQKSSISIFFKAVENLDVESFKAALEKEGKLSLENKEALLYDLNNIEKELSDPGYKGIELISGSMRLIFAAGLFWAGYMSNYTFQSTYQTIQNNFDKSTFVPIRKIIFADKTYIDLPRISSGARIGFHICQTYLVSKLLDSGVFAGKRIKRFFTNYKEDFENINKIRELINSAKIV